MRRHCSKKQLKTVLEKFFFYTSFQRIFFKENEFEVLFFAIIWTKNITRFCYSASLFGALIHFNILSPSFFPFLSTLLGTHFWIWPVVILSVILITSLFIADFLPRAFASHHTHAVISLFAPLSSLYLFLCFPFLFIFLKLSKSLSHTFFDNLHAPHSQLKEKIIEIIQESENNIALDPDERKLIESIVTFRDRIVREVMIPRVKIFALPSNTSIREAARLLFEEGYSRVPIFHENIDDIIGILMYKDILNCYMECENTIKERSFLEGPIENIVKKVLYTPETKKVSLLLKEFRNKQMHFAVVVDEYGGTEGIVTIEDILEEIVGEISDEYDDEEEVLFAPQSDGSWVVDAHMSIIDAEEKLDIIIPQDGEYETIGGYIFHRTGVIPSTGFIIHLDGFDLEILTSNDRRVKKVKIIPIRSNSDNQESVSD